MPGKPQVENGELSEGGMRLYYWKADTGNFGDDLNVWLWDELMPGWRGWSADRLLVGVGTILNADHLPLDPVKLVIGSGYGYGSPPDVADLRKWDVRCVRGPNTARVLGLPDSCAITDPAALISRLPAFADIPKTGKTLFIPHVSSDCSPDFDWPAICASAGIEYVSPRGESRSVIRAIAGADRVITESMHGAIIADAFRVPWIAVSLSRVFNDVKWRDWFESLGVEAEIHRIRSPKRSARQLANALRLGKRPLDPAPSSEPQKRTIADYIIESVHGALLARALRRLRYGRFTLSSTRRLDAALSRLEAVISDVQGDFGRVGVTP